VWKVKILNKTVEKELSALPRDAQSKFSHIVVMIEESGLERVHYPYVKHLLGKLWEMRLTGKDGIARAMYIIAFEKKVIVVRVFVKKTQKTPKQEIELALERAKEIKR
jgi:phage-related protein